MLQTGERGRLGAAGAAIVLWSTNAWAASSALTSMSVPQLLTVQFGSAAVLLAALRLRRVHARSLTVNLSRAGGGRERLLAVGIGVLGVSGTVIFQYAAFGLAPMLSANTLSYAWPLLAAVVSAAILRTSRSLLAVGCAAVGFLGVALIFADGRIESGTGTLLGLLFAVASASCMAAYTVAAGRLALDARDTMLPAVLVGTVLAGAASVLESVPWPPPTGSLWAVYIGLGPMALGYGLWTYAVSGPTGETRVPLGYATPLLSTGLLLATGDSASAQTLIGAALVLVCSVGALLLVRSRAPRQPGECSPAPVGS